MKADATLDCVGLYCPVPIVQTSKKIKELAPGEVLQVVATDKGIVKDMPAWCESTGHEFLKVEEVDGEWHAYVRKKAV